MLGLIECPDIRYYVKRTWIPSQAGNDKTESFVLKERQAPPVIPVKTGIHAYMKCYYVYILANERNGTLYIGVTSDLIKRVYEHKNDLIKGFTKKYKVHKLVYYEQTTDVESAIQREKQLKKWNREWKIDLIEKHNLHWKDLFDELI